MNDKIDNHNDDNQDISSLYQSMSTEATPRHLDETILTAARAMVGSVKPKVPFYSKWAMPLSVAAVFVLSVSIITTIQKESPEELISAPMDSDIAFAPSAKPAPARPKAAEVEEKMAAPVVNTIEPAIEQQQSKELVSDDELVSLRKKITNRQRLARLNSKNKAPVAQSNAVIEPESDLFDVDPAAATILSSGQPQSFSDSNSGMNQSRPTVGKQRAVDKPILTERIDDSLKTTAENTVADKENKLSTSNQMLSRDVIAKSLPSVKAKSASAPALDMDHFKADSTSDTPGRFSARAEQAPAIVKKLNKPKPTAADNIDTIVQNKAAELELESSLSRILASKSNSAAQIEQEKRSALRMQEEKLSDSPLESRRSVRSILAMAEKHTEDQLVCQALSQQACLQSATCQLVLEEDGLICKVAENACESGFIQQTHGEKQCIVNPGCWYRPGQCECKSENNCQCGKTGPALCELLN